MTITVAELIARLQKLPQNLAVLATADGREPEHVVGVKQQPTHEAYEAAVLELRAAPAPEEDPHEVPNEE